MSYDEFDAMQDAAYDSMYADFAKTAIEDEKIYNQIVDDFADYRLKEFYLDHPNVIEKAKGALEEARRLLPTSARCSLVFAATAAEVCLRNALWEPILHGSFHNKSSGDLIVSLLVRMNSEHLKRALLDILNQHTGIDLREFKRNGSKKPLREEMKEIAQIRNKILHEADTASKHDAVRAIDVAESLISDVFGETVGKLGLDLRNGLVCGRAR
jgi:hypothetical protein